MNKTLIRIEGLLVFILGTYFYFSNGYAWWLFLLLLLSPDVLMVGDYFNKRVGAYLYNFAHTYTTPLLILLIGYALSVSTFIMIGFIWLAHIGMDRMLGYGLKYETGFKDTHIQNL